MTITIIISTMTAVATEPIFTYKCLFFVSPTNSSLNCDGILEMMFDISRIETPLPMDFSVRICPSHIIIPVPAVIDIVIKITHRAPFPEISPFLLNPIAIQQL